MQLIDERVVGKTNRDRYVGGGFEDERIETGRRTRRKAKRRRGGARDSSAHYIRVNSVVSDS